MKLFLFDFDGVLVESLDVYYRIVNAALEKINQPLTGGCEEFLDLFTGNFYESLVARGVDLNRFFTASAGPLADVKYQEMKPVAAMPPVVAELSRNNILVIISSNDSKTIRPALEKFGYNGCFQEVWGSDFMLSKKDKMIHARGKYNISPAEIYYVGDTTGDIVEGKAAGVKTVGVTWGWHSKEKIAAAHPDYLINDSRELLKIPSL